MRRTLILLFCILAHIFNSYGQNPPSIKWEQINSPHFKIIYPNELSKQANYASQLLEKAYYKTSKLYGNKPKPIKLFLLNQSVTSNGYVALGPRRMAWYTTPSQETQMIGNADWFQALAIHEYRHVVQFSKLDTNLTSFVSTLLGDIGRSICYSVSSPNWYFEGDAVYAETQFSNNGRGRMPSFYRDIYCLEDNNIRYKYQKAYLGSYKDYFPNWYHLGYLMTDHIISNYGDTIMRQAVEHSTKLSIFPWAFSRGLKTTIGHNIKHTYLNTLDEFKLLHKHTKRNQPISNLHVKNNKYRKIFTNYYYPYPLGSDSIIAYKKGFNNSGELVVLYKDTESELIKINPIDRIHSNGKDVVWSTTIPDIRWPEQSYSDIVTFNIKNKVRTRLTYKQKLFAPAISPDGSKITAIEYNPKMECSLVIIDSKTGNYISKKTFPIGITIRNPQWNRTSNKIVCTQNKGQINSLLVYNTQSNNHYTIDNFGSENISNPIFYKNYILFNAPYYASDAIVAIDTNSNNLFLVASTKYGAYNASINYSNNQLLVQNYTAQGYNIESINIDFEKWKKIERNYYKQRISANMLWPDEKSENLFEAFTMDATDQLAESKRYLPLLNSINIHSWFPYPINNGVGFNVITSDELNTTFATAGIEYFPKDFATRLFTEITYAGLYPEMSFNYSGGRNYIADTVNENSFQKIDENVLGFSFNVPLNLSVFNNNATLNIYSGFDKVYQKKYFDSTLYAELDLSLINGGFDYSKLRRTAYRDVMPKLGINLSSVYYKALNNTSDFNSRSTSQFTAYLPAPLNHGIKLMGGMELNKVSPNSSFVYQLNTDLEMVYGYASPNFLSNTYINGVVMYGMPLLYPDLALGSFLYCKRIRSNIFYNYGSMVNDNYTLDLSSYGFELHGEFSFFNIYLPIELGARFSYRTLDKTMAIEFMLMGVAF